MKKPLVWIISHFAGGPSYCPRIPDYSLAKYLRENGYEALIFAGSALHNTDINFISDGKISEEKMIDGVPFAFIKTRSYKSRKGQALGFVNFYINLLRSYKRYPKPDIIIAAMPQPLSCLAGVQIANKIKVPYITSIVDLWPLSIVEYADFSDYNPIIQAMYMYEKWLYKKSKQLVFTWAGAYDYIIDKGWSKIIPKDKFNYINIGVNLKEFFENKEKYTVDDKDLQDDVFRVMYCGSIRTANDIDTVVSCAKKLNQDGFEKRIRFIIYGEGPDKDVLIKRCKREGISNVIFKGYIDKKHIPFVLSKSDLNILNLKPARTQKYGNSSNKLFEYLAAGNPVIANIDEGKYPIISKYKCGRVVKAGSPEEYAEGIKYFYKLNNEDMLVYKNNATSTAKIFDTEILNSKWKEVISSEIKKKE